MRYVIIEKSDGVFLGAYQGEYIFARNCKYPIATAPSFDTIELAEFYISMYMPLEEKTYGVIEVDSNKKYVSAIDIIKAGYEDYTHNMVNNLPMISGAIH